MSTRTMPDAAAVAAAPSPPAAASSPRSSATAPPPHALCGALRNGLAVMQFDPAGQERYAQLAARAGELLALVQAAAPDDAGAAAEPDSARLAALGSAVFDTPLLAGLIRTALAEAVEAARGNPRELLTVCRALRHVPAWALESGAEREARIATEQAVRLARVRPGHAARAAAAERRLFDGGPRDASQQQHTQRDAQHGKRLAGDRAPQNRAWRDPACCFHGPDRELLDTLATPDERRAQRLTAQAAVDLLCRAWVEIAREQRHNCPRGLRLLTGRVITPAEARDFVEAELEDRMRMAQAVAEQLGLEG